MRGIFAVYKPPGLTSADVTNIIRKELTGEYGYLKRQSPLKSRNVPHHQVRAKGYVPSQLLKVGHGGTLDKAAEGVLVIGVGDDCKNLSLYLHGDKTYIAEGTLGIATDTHDREGHVIDQRPYDHVSELRLKKVLKMFKGEHLQIPPVYSSLKIKGQRASDLARQGCQQYIEMTSRERSITIYDITLNHFQPPKFTLMISCSSGTYIRKLIHDIGHKLCTVAYMSSLCRTRQGLFTSENALSMDQWTFKVLKSLLKE